MNFEIGRKIQETKAKAKNRGQHTKAHMARLCKKLEIYSKTSNTYKYRP